MPQLTPSRENIIKNYVHQSLQTNILHTFTHHQLLQLQQKIDENAQHIKSNLLQTNDEVHIDSACNFIKRYINFMLNFVLNNFNGQPILTKKDLTHAVYQRMGVYNFRYLSPEYLPTLPNNIAAIGAELKERVNKKLSNALLILLWNMLIISLPPELRYQKITKSTS